MGIQGLLKALKPFTHPVHVSKYAGQRVGIDAYSWLHKGAYGCSTELCTQSNLVPAEDPSKLQYVKYCMHRIFLLKYNGVVPVMVFDGGRLPLKAATENERQRQRQKNLELAEENQARGDSEGAKVFFQKAVEITPLMAHELIRVLKDNGVEFVVAPYEADAQLAWLAKRPPESGGVAAVISEDSDLLAYGCPVVIFKMDGFGQGEEIAIDQVFESGTVSGSKLSFGKFDADMFLGMCVLTGCDFLPSIPGIGVMKAHAIVDKYGGDLDWVLSKIAKEKKVTLPERYIPDFWQARAIFLHARVYDTNKRMLDYLNPLPEDFEEKCGPDTEFLGPELPQSRARAIAQGSLDPITMCAFNISERKTSLFTSQLKHSRTRIKQSESISTTGKGPFAFFSPRRPTPASSFVSEPVSVSSSKDGEDHSFAAHLQHMAVRSTVLQEHNGLKRVLPPLPDNNPFKRARREDGFSVDQVPKSGGKENRYLDEEEVAGEDPEVVMSFLPDHPSGTCQVSEFPVAERLPHTQHSTLSPVDLTYTSIVGRSSVSGIPALRPAAGGKPSKPGKNRQLPKVQKVSANDFGILRFFKPVANR